MCCRAGAAPPLDHRRLVLLLLGATAVYLLLGDPQEAILLSASVLLVIALTVYQEHKSERALQALRDLSSPRARVLRDGELRLLAGRGLVVGDIVLVSEGERVPADARVIEEADLHVDESMLTGESVPVHRVVASDSGRAQPARKSRPRHCHVRNRGRGLHDGHRARTAIHAAGRPRLHRTGGGDLGLILLYRAGTSLWDTLRQPNPAFWVVAPVTLVVLAVVTRFELLARWFGFAPPPVGPWLLALLLPLLAAALLKAVQPQRTPRVEAKNDPGCPAI